MCDEVNSVVTSHYAGTIRHGNTLSECGRNIARDNCTCIIGFTLIIVERVFTCVLPLCAGCDIAFVNPSAVTVKVRRGFSLPAAVRVGKDSPAVRVIDRNIGELYCSVALVNKVSGAVKLRGVPA